MDVSSIYTSEDVASTCRHPKLVIYYTDWHDVDEDRATTLVQGAKWTDIIQAGIMCRNMWYHPTSDFYGSVASSNMQKYRIIRITMMSTKI